MSLEMLHLVARARREESRDDTAKRNFAWYAWVDHQDTSCRRRDMIENNREAE